MTQWNARQRAAAHAVVIADIQQAMINAGYGFFVYMVTEEKVGPAVDAMLNADTVENGMKAARLVLLREGYSDKIGDMQLRAEVVRARAAAGGTRQPRALQWPHGDA